MKPFVSYVPWSITWLPTLKLAGRGSPRYPQGLFAEQADVLSVDNVVRAPMAGTFYKASEPGAEPFVKVGQRVEVGDVLCIIESMKMMNEITAQIPGTVARINIANGEAVASEQVLLFTSVSSMSWFQDHPGSLGR